MATVLPGCMGPSSWRTKGTPCGPWPDVVCTVRFWFQRVQQQRPGELGRFTNQPSGWRPTSASLCGRCAASALLAAPTLNVAIPCPRVKGSTRLADSKLRSIAAPSTAQRPSHRNGRVSLIDLLADKTSPGRGGPSMCGGPVEVLLTNCEGYILRLSLVHAGGTQDDVAGTCRIGEVRTRVTPRPDQHAGTCAASRCSDSRRVRVLPAHARWSRVVGPGLEGEGRTGCHHGSRRSPIGPS